MKSWITHTLLLLVLAASAGCTSFRMPFADSPRGHPMESTDAHAPASPPPAVPSRVPQAVAPPPRPHGENNMTRGTAVSPRAAVKVAPLPPPPAARSFHEDFSGQGKPTLGTAAERAAVAERVFPRNDADALQAQAEELVSVEPVLRPPSKTIPYWTRPELNAGTHQEGDGAADRNSLPMNESGLLVTWPSPVALPVAVLEVWGLYRRFEFEQVLESATEFASRETSRGYPLAASYVLAAASAYLLGEPELAREFIVSSLAVDAFVRPDPKTFPDSFCVLFNLMKKGGPAELADLGNSAGRRSR